MSSISAGTTSTTTLVHSGDTTGSLVFKTNDTGSGGTTAVTIDTSQNVGIGTSSPVSKLNINGGAVTLAETTLGLYNIDFQSRTASTNARIQYDQVTNSTGQLLFYTNGGSLTERMRIDSSGNLLVGTTSQNLGGRLFNVKTSGDVAGSFYRATSATNAEVLETRSDVSSTNVQKFCVYGNGDVKNTTGSYASFSDARIKENIVDATPKLDDLLKVRIVNYNLIEDTDKLKMIGVIAQELETVFPNLVDENQEGIKGVKYSIFIPMLIKSIQELKAINDQQAETINALTARVVALESK